MTWTDRVGDRAAFDRNLIGWPTGQPIKSPHRPITMSNPNPPAFLLSGAPTAAPAVAPLLPIPEEMMRVVRSAPVPFEYRMEALMNGYSLELAQLGGVLAPQRHS